MKVLIVGSYPPPYGGASVQIAVLHRLLSATPGIISRVLDIGASRHERRTKCLPARNPLEFSAQVFAHAARQFHLHLHTNGHNLKSWMITLCCAVAGILNGRKTLVSIGSGAAPDFIQQSGWFRRCMISAALRLMGAIICRNERTRTTVVGLGIHPQRVHIVPGFYGLTAVPNPVIPGRIEQFLRAHSRILAAMASSGPEYGIPVFLEAARRLRSHYPGLGVLLIGPERVDVEGLDGDLLMAGEQPHDVALAIMPRVTVFVRPTTFDGDASSIREALALKVPVVASDTDFRPAGVILFRPGDVDGLTDTLAQIFDGRINRPPEPAAEPNTFERLLEIYVRLEGKRR